MPLNQLQRNINRTAIIILLAHHQMPYILVLLPFKQMHMAPYHLKIDQIHYKHTE